MPKIIHSLPLVGNGRTPELMASDGLRSVGGLQVASGWLMQTPFGLFVLAIPRRECTDTSIRRTLGSVPLVSVLKRFDCKSKKYRSETVRCKLVQKVLTKFKSAFNTLALKCFYTVEIKPTHNSVGLKKMEATSQNRKKAGLASRNKNNR